MRFEKLIFLVLIMSLLSCKSSSNKSVKVENTVVEQEQTEYKEFKFPKPVGYVSDYGHILSETETKELRSIIKEFGDNTTNEIFIITIGSIAPYTDIHKFATDLANNWGVGKVKKDNGLVIVVSKEIKKIAISTGKGTEKIVTDKICKNILKTIVVPKFKEEQYFIGLKKGLIEIILKWK